MRQIFWGLLIVAIDLRINGFDLLPDGIGYGLMAWGCGGLVPLSRQFAMAQPLAWALALLWLISLAVPPKAGLVFGLAAAVVNCNLMWQLLGGMSDFANGQGRYDLGGRAMILRIVYVVLIASITLVGILAHPSFERRCRA